MLGSVNFSACDEVARKSGVRMTFEIVFLHGSLFASVIVCLIMASSNCFQLLEIYSPFKFWVGCLGARQLCLPSGSYVFYLPRFQTLRHTPSPYTYWPVLKFKKNLSLQQLFLYFVLSDYIKNCRNPFKYTTSKNLIVTSVRITQKHDFEKQLKPWVNLNYQVNH